MSGWHLGILAPFDLETTGVDVETDRIVTAFVGFVDGSGKREPKTKQWLVNPGIDIPEPATAIHGITTAQANAEGMDPAAAVAEIRDALYGAWATGAPVVGFNLAYDFTLLDREMGRHLGEQLEVAGPVVDSYVIDGHLSYRKGKRTLTACCEHYGVRLGGAHDAAEDALASARLAWVIAAQNSSIGERSLENLHKLQVVWHRERRESFAAYLRKQGKDASDVDGSWPLRPRTAAAAA